MKGILSALQVAPNASTYQNPDILPLPASRRTWTRRTFVFFWLATCINIAEWSGASTALAIGLTVGQALAVNAISTLIVLGALLLNGHGGANWHIPFVLLGNSRSMVPTLEPIYPVMLLVWRSRMVRGSNGESDDWCYMAGVLYHAKYVCGRF
ncbi:hypothetical protein BDQ17DRAFT_160632 [Cyathus striatus]|nr:hypothetical protein BDQ17DRAFT_160632 [Cyathus striatus]